MIFKKKDKNSKQQSFYADFLLNDPEHCMVFMLISLLPLELIYLEYNL